MSEFSLQSPQLLDFEKVKNFGANIRFHYQPNLYQEFQDRYAGYYIYKIPANVVEKVFFETFFQSAEYIEALQRKAISSKWIQYIKGQKRGNFYIIDSGDYNGELLKYFTQNSDQEMDIEFYGELFWIYHDIGHVYLKHLYSLGTFRHKQEMDASLFAVIRLLQEKIFDESAIMKLVNVAVGPLLKTGKIIDKHDYKYFLIQVNYFKKTLGTV